MRIQYANEFIQNMGLGDPKKYVYQFKVTKNKLYNILSYMDWDYA